MKLLIALVLVVGCGSVSAVQLQDGAPADVQSTEAAAGAVGSGGAGGELGGRGGAGGGELGGRGGAGGASSGGTGHVSNTMCTGTRCSSAGGSGGAVCSWDVIRGCAGQNVSGTPCNVCRGTDGNYTRCLTDGRPGAGTYCVPDCADCQAP